MIRTILILISVLSVLTSAVLPQTREPVKRRVIEIPREARTPRAQEPVMVIGDLKLNGLRTKPTTVKVNWTIDVPADTRIEGYVITLELKNNGVTDQVVQTPSPTSTSVFVGLLGISAENRAKLFGNGTPVEAQVRLSAKLIKGTQRSVLSKLKAVTI